jgi:ParB/RepB/Spo0J family partition protein
MKAEMKDNLLEIPLEKITVSKWDIRMQKEDEKKYEALKRSISAGGLLHPVTVMSNGNGGYLLAAGRRRFRACKELGMKTIPAFLQSEHADELDVRTITVIENLHRRSLSEFERAYGIHSIYESAGYTSDEAIKGAKAIDNWFSHNTDHKVNWERFEDVHNSVVQIDGEEPRYPSGHRCNPIFLDNNFIKTCKMVAFSPKYQYQILQETRDIPKKVLKKASDLGLSGQKTRLLTHSKLREHPKVQQKLVSDLAKKQSTDLARDKIYQTISDLETGALKKQGQSYVRHDSLRQNVSKETKQANLSEATKASRIRAACKKLIQTITNETLRKSEIRYEKEHVDKGREYEINIVKLIDESELTQLESNLQIAKYTIDQLLNLIDREFDSRERNRSMIEK